MGIRQRRLIRQGISVRIDKLTNSIESRLTKEKLDTEVLPLLKSDIKNLNKKDWIFNWKKEFEEFSNISLFYKLTLKGDAKIQGLLEIQVRDNFIFMPLIESMRMNTGKNKKYIGIPGNLVAYACKMSLEKGFGGYLSFDSKSKLMNHYEETLGAERLFGITMVIKTEAALKLINTYKL